MTGQPVQVSATSSPIPPRKALANWVVGAALLAVAATGLALGAVRLFLGENKKETVADAGESPTGNGAMVHLKEEAVTLAGIRAEKLVAQPFRQVVRVPGRLALDETLLAHINPMVEGIIQEVNARLGQEVNPGDVLATLDCREVAQSKLDLVRARLALSHANALHLWTAEVTSNTHELVVALLANKPITEIERMFRNRSLGDLRQQLLTAYSRRLQTKSQYDAVNQPDVLGAVSQSSLLKLRADSEAAEASFFALCEELKFQSAQQLRLSDQKLGDASTAEALSKANLLMLGFSRSEVESLNPLAEGETVSRYAVRSPIAGTIIEQHAVLRERTGPLVQMFQVANRSRLWLKADVPQRDIVLAQALAGGVVRFDTGDRGAISQEARVLYTGEVVDPNTRTVNLLAGVDNRNRQWKPGMFVEVELVRADPGVLQVPLEAVQRVDTQAFVFVRDSAENFHRIDVTLGREAGGRVEVRDGLKEGIEVVVAGGFILKSELFKEQLAGD